MALPSNFHDLHRREFPGAVLATKNAAQNFNSGAVTTVIFNTEIIDTDGQYNPATGVFTAKVAGLYQVTAAVALGATNAFAPPEQYRLDVYWNGGQAYVLGFCNWYNAGATNIYPFHNGTALVNCGAAGDTMTIRVFQNSAAVVPCYNIAQWNYFNVLRVSP